MAYHIFATKPLYEYNPYVVKEIEYHFQSINDCTVYYVHDSMSAVELNTLIKTLTLPGNAFIFVDVVPYLLAKLAARAAVDEYAVWVFHNRKLICIA